MAGNFVENIKSRLGTATQSGGLLKGMLSPFSGNVGFFGQSSGILSGAGSGQFVDDKLNFLAKKFRDAAAAQGMVSKVLTLLRPQILISMGISGPLASASGTSGTSSSTSGDVTKSGFFGAVTAKTPTQKLNERLSS